MKLRVSRPEIEGVYQGSKWLKTQVLCEAEELEQLFNSLSPFFIFPLTGVVKGEEIPVPVFLQEYAKWIDGLRQGAVPSEQELKKLLACAFIDDLDALWLQDVGKGFLTKICRPVVQVQAHFFSYSRIDGVFRPMSLGRDSIFWGIQMSFPQIYQNPQTMDLCEADASGFFRKIQLWARETTRATPFLVDGKRINAPIRIGKKCLSWISNHPQLIEQNIQVDGN